MIVSWKWLERYVDLNMPADELFDRLTMSGLNFEGSEDVFDDVAIDLEVTSNRPDCLGHIGVAREVAVLYEQALKIPAAMPQMGNEKVADVCRVAIECPELCSRYTARLIRGVKIGPSPEWLADRLRTIGIAVVNNVVDATNYVMFECGQPLHAFDFAKIDSGRIVVREAKKGESFFAIDHKSYELTPGMCVISDAENSVAIGGVMGGAESEVSESTTDVLLEAAVFEPLSVRNTARKLNLHSPSSFRFERTINEENIDWASRRCCELILEIAGGELLEGVVDEGSRPVEREPIVLRLSQLKRVLGIEIPADFVPACLERLGLTIHESDSNQVQCTAPAWRADLSREVDLIEEVGRVYGFENVPDNASVPMAASYKTRNDRVLDSVRASLTAYGFDEAMTPSLVPEPWSAAFSPWCDQPPLISSQPMLGVLEKASKNIGAVEFLRRSIVPSLLEARRINEYRSNHDIELFETSKVYLNRPDAKLPDQPEKVALVSGHDFHTVKAIICSMVERLNASAKVEMRECEFDLFDIDQSTELLVNGKILGWIGRISKSGAKEFKLRGPAVVAEFDMGMLADIATIIPLHENQSLFPAVARDFNFIVSNELRWAELESTVADAGGELLESVVYRETFRDEAKDGPEKKRLLLSVVLRSSEATLTGEQADAVCQAIIGKCEAKLNAALVL